MKNSIEKIFLVGLGLLFSYKGIASFRESFSDFSDTGNDFMAAVNTATSLPSSMFVLPINALPLHFLLSEKLRLTNQPLSCSLIPLMAKQ